MLNSIKVCEGRFIMNDNETLMNFPEKKIRGQFFDYAVKLEAGLKKQMSPKEFENFVFPKCGNDFQDKTNVLKNAKSIFAYHCMNFYRQSHSMNIATISIFSLDPKSDDLKQAKFYKNNIIDSMTINYMESYAVFYACSALYLNEQGRLLEKVKMDQTHKLQLWNFGESLRKSVESASQNLRLGPTDFDSTLLCEFVRLLEEYLNSSEMFLKTIKKEAFVTTERLDYHDDADSD